MTTPPRTLDEIRRAGLQALAQALGPVGMVRFLLQYETGVGDYTADRHRWLDGLSIEDVARNVGTQPRRDDAE